MRNKFIIISIAIIIISGFIFADTNSVWHRAEDILGGVFGGDEQANTQKYIFINPVEFNDTITVNNGVKVDVIKSNNANGNVIMLFD